MSIRPVLRAVTRSSAESIDLRGLEEQTRRARVSGRYRIAAVSLKGLRFMQGDEFPANLILGNSEALGRRKGPRSNSLGPLLYLPRRARTINTARACPLTGGGENLAIIDSYYVAPRRRPERTGES